MADFGHIVSITPEFAERFSAKKVDDDTFTFVYHDELADKLANILYDLAVDYEGEWVLKENDITRENIIDEWFGTKSKDNDTYRCRLDFDWDHDCLNVYIDNRESSLASIDTSIMWNIKHFRDEWGDLTEAEIDGIIEYVRSKATQN